MGATKKGQEGHVTPLDFDIIFFHIITVAPRVVIQIKGLNLSAPLDIQWSKMLSASGGEGLCPWTPLGALPQNPLYARAPHSPWCLPTTDPFRRLWPPCGRLCELPYSWSRRLCKRLHLLAALVSAELVVVIQRVFQSVFVYCAAGSRVVDGKSVELWRSVVSAQPSTSFELFVRPTRQRILSPSRVYGVYWIGRAEQNWRLNCRQFRQNMIAECNSYW